MEAALDPLALRKALGWTQPQMAEHLDCDRSTVSRLERDPSRAKRPVREMLEALRDRLTKRDGDAA